MMEEGLLEEAKNMLSTEKSTSAQAIGHKELAKYINGETTLEEAKNKLKQESRRYAKRQITWFKRRNDAVFVTYDRDTDSQTKSVIAKCEDFLNG